MRSKLITMFLGASLISAAACATKPQTGAVVGAGAGGVVGAGIGGTTGALVGAAVGGLFGYTVGRAVEEEDRRQVAYALEANRSVSWRSSETGYRYDVQPTRTFVEEDRPCREFRMRTEGGQESDEVHGTACRRSDGSWELIST